jgi:hypothetical protein
VIYTITTAHQSINQSSGPNNSAIPPLIFYIVAK